MTSNQEIAETILKHLGGQRSLHVMTGAKNFVAIDRGVRFQINSRLSRPNISHFEIRLNLSDLYDVKLILVRGRNTKEVTSSKDIYADDLRDFIERHTGLVLTVPKVYRASQLSEQQQG